MPDRASQLGDFIKTTDGHRAINHVISLMETAVRMHGFVPPVEAELAAQRLRQILNEYGDDA